MVSQELDKDQNSCNKTHQPQTWVANKSYNKTRKKHGKVFSCCKKYDTYNIGTIQFFWTFKKKLYKKQSVIQGDKT